MRLGYVSATLHVVQPRSLFLGLVFYLATPAFTAAAQSEDASIAEARSHFDRGEEFYERGNYALSREEFVRVYELMVGHPNRGLVLYNIARCHDQLQQYDEAIANYERFLIEAPNETPERADARNRVAELRIRLREGRADPVEEAATGPDPSPPSDSSPAEAIGPMGLAGIAVAAVGLGAGIAAAVTGGVAHSVYMDLETLCGADGNCPARSRADAEYGSSLADASTALTFAAIGTVAVGVVLLIIDLVTGDSTELRALLFQPGPMTSSTTMGAVF